MHASLTVALLAALLVHSEASAETGFLDRVVTLGTARDL
jgi:hypothetical protein